MMNLEMPMDFVVPQFLEQNHSAETMMLTKC